MQELGNLVPGQFFFARHFLCKEEKMKGAWKSTEVKDLILPGTCYEKMKSAWSGRCGRKGHFLPGNYKKMKSAWKSTDVKDLIMPGTCYEKIS